MAGIYDSVPIITFVLFVLGLLGIMVYERSRSSPAKESNS